MRTMERLPVACLCLLLSCSAVGSAGSRVDVFEDSDVILPCSLSTKEDIRSKTFDWKKNLQEVFLYDDGSHYNNGRTGQHEQFKGRVSHFPDELQHGNASITINKIKVADSGKYTCYFPRLQPPQTFHIELVVAPILKDRRKEKPGAAAKPSVKILHQTNHWALLQCEVKGASPKPKVEWKDSSGNILHAEEPLVSERGNYSDIIVNITVTKTDTYRCVATQKEINHQAEAETYVYISGRRVVVVEDSDAILPCSLSTKENITSKTFDWTKDPLKDVFLYDAGSHYDKGLSGQDEQFKGRVSHFPDELQHGDASIIIRKTKLADSGNYTCYFPNLQSRQTSHIELVVAAILKDRSAENLPGAAPKPSVTGLHQKQDRVLLQCEVKGASPKPEVEWRDSSGNILPAEEPLVSESGGSFNITITTTVTKTDHYRCVSTQKKINHQIEAHTYVYISGRRVVVVEDSDVILPCSLNTKEDIRSKLFDWTKDRQKEVFLYDDGLYYDNGLSGQDNQFKGRVSHFPDKLQHGDASIIIRKTKLADSGKYTCYFPNLQPRQTFHIELVVAPILKDRSAENLPGAAPKPSVTILDQTYHRSLLQCEVKGASPKPEVEWKDRSGNILPAEETLVSERGGSFNIILTTTVTKTDRYRCVSTQKEINHQIEAEIHVFISESSSGWVVPVLFAIIAVLVLVVVILCIKQKRGSTSASQPAAGEEVALKDSSSKEATEP